MKLSGCFVSHDFALRFEDVVFNSMTTVVLMGNSSAWQILLSRSEEVFLLSDVQQLPLPSVVLSDEMLQNPDDDRIRQLLLSNFCLPKNVVNFVCWQPSFLYKMLLGLAPNIRTPK